MCWGRVRWARGGGVGPPGGGRGSGSGPRLPEGGLPGGGGGAWWLEEVDWNPAHGAALASVSRGKIVVSASALGCGAGSGRASDVKFLLMNRPLGGIAL